MRQLNQIYILIGGFILFIIWISYYSYFDLKKQYILENEKVKADIVAQVRTIASENSLDFNLDKFEYKINTLILNTHLEGVKLEYTNFKFTNNTIYSKISTLDKSWEIIDVTTDIASGQITNLLEGEYLFVPAKNFDFKKPVTVKFQAAKDRFIRDFTILLPFVVEIGSVSSKNLIEESRYNLYYNLSQFDSASKINHIFIRFAIVLIVIFLLLIVFYFIYRKQLRKELYVSITKIDTYITNVLNKNFQNPEELYYNQQELDSLVKNIATLVKNFAQSVNELNVTKDIIEKKEITDELTGLPNKKWFEKDLKYLFVSNKPSYVIYLKIDQLGEFTKKHGGDNVNRLIEDFVKIVGDFFMKNREFEGKLYRFFGAEFAILLYVEEAEKVRKILTELILLTETLKERYYFFNNYIYYGGAPFDKYGTIDSILESTKEEYQEAYNSKNNFFQISDLSDQLEKNKELETSVRDNIEREDFALQYVYDTYDFNPIQKLIMQEVTPMLIDMRTFEKLPVGVFISVAEKIEQASEFDKILIKKALSQISMGNIEHKIAINLSVGSFKSMRFITWLSSIMNYESGAKNLVFVITAYSASGNFEEYKRFVDTIVEFEAEVMLKRFDLNEFSLEQLERIKPHYIRIGRDDCNDIKRDTAKQHKIKKILLFAEEFNIKVLGDSVKNEIDYETLEKLGFYGASK